MPSGVIERIKIGNLLFSIISLSTCTLIIILIAFQKQLRSITYTFLMSIFISEILHNIGNIMLDKLDISDGNISSYEAKNLSALSFIAFSDIFTNLLFIFFTYCSIKLIKETNKLIKKKVSRFIIISAVISVVYMSVVLGVSIAKDKYVDIRFRGFYQEDDASHLSTVFYVLSSIHMFLIIVFSILSTRNTYVVVSFMAEKQQMDKVNAKSIARLRKILGRYPIICILYWIFLIPRIIFVAKSGEQHILRDSLYFVSEASFRIRGFLIFLNTFRSSKIQSIIHRIIELNIKHDCLLNLKILYKKRANSYSKSRNNSTNAEEKLIHIEQ